MIKNDKKIPFSLEKLGKMQKITVISPDGDTVEINYSDLRLVVSGRQLCWFYKNSDDGDLIMPICRLSTIKTLGDKSNNAVNIGSNKEYPSSALSNFAEHHFTIDGIECSSMEGFLQSLKFEDIIKQNYVCSLIGKKAKYMGKPRKWWTTQTLWWQGKKIDRHSQEYQDLLDRVYNELSRNEDFQKALLSTKDFPLTHLIGKNNPHYTILTVNEFCGRLLKIRENLNEQR